MPTGKKETVISKNIGVCKIVYKEGGEYFIADFYGETMNAQDRKSIDPYIYKHLSEFIDNYVASDNAEAFKDFALSKINGEDFDKIMSLNWTKLLGEFYMKIY